MNRLRLVLGDQLSLDGAALADLDASTDAVLMIEAASESTTVWSTKPRIAIFLSAMRHFAVEVVARGWPLIYVRLDDALPGGFAERLEAALATHRPGTLVVHRARRMADARDRAARGDAGRLRARPAGRHALPLLAGGVRDLGREPQVVAHGVLLSMDARAARDPGGGGRRTRRRSLELRRRQPQGFSGERGPSPCRSRRASSPTR